MCVIVVVVVVVLLVVVVVVVVVDDVELENRQLSLPVTPSISPIKHVRRWDLTTGVWLAHMFGN